ASGVPFSVGTCEREDAGPPHPNRSEQRGRRGERRQFPRYHPSCGFVGRQLAQRPHLLAVLGMGATHPDLLDGPEGSGVFLRPAAPGRVQGCVAGPGLAPSPGRSSERISYWSPSSRVVV
ncbi:MAG: hypothetical protein AVDCRST_MAG43-1765, partial [uncultured Thermomicrobiales bacterium]